MKITGDGKIWSLLWVASLTIILVGSFLPENSRGSEMLSPQWWNLGHVPAYAVFAFSTLMVLSQRIRVTYWSISMTGAIVGLFGIVIELLQPYFGRMANVSDLYFDAVGLLIGVLGFVLMKHLLVRLGPDRPRRQHRG